MAVGADSRIPGSEPAEHAERTVRIRARALIFGLLLIWPIGRWLFEGEMVRYTFTTWAAPFYNAIYVLFLLTLANMAMGKLFKWQPFNYLELLSIYVIVSVSSALLSTDLMGILITLMGFPARFATESNGWSSLFAEALPRWLMVTDADALKGFYEGNSTLYTWEHVRVWLAPSLWWMLFIAALFVAFLSLGVLLRKQWADSEKLTFPIVQLPLAMAEAPSRFFSDRLMWLGFIIAGGITLVNGLAFLFPNVPTIAIKRQAIEVFTTLPWQAINPLTVGFYFFAITLGFLMPLDLSVSLWVFYFLYMGEKVFVASLGFESGSGFPYRDSQAFGAYIALGLFAIWGARKHLASAYRSAFRGGKKEDEGEPTSYHTAFLALAVSLIVLVAFMYAAGMMLPIAVSFVVILVALAIAISRIRCELGFPVHDLHGMGPNDVLPSLVGTQHLTPSTLGTLSLFYWTCRSFRSHPMPHQMEGFRLAGGPGAASRDMLRVILIAGLLAIPLCFWIYLYGFYKLGAGTAHVGVWGTAYGFGTFQGLERCLKNPAEGVPARWVAMAIGGLIATVLGVMRMRVPGFPLHPLGYAVASSWGMDNLWVPIMVGSMCKGLVLRTGGLRVYRRAVMFFFGLMLGEFVIGCSWTVLGMIFGIRTYDFWP